MKTVLRVDGMACSHCSNSVISALMKNEQVNNVEVDLDKKIVTIDSSKQISISVLKQIIQDLGYEVL